MKRAIVVQRLPHLLLGGVLTALLVASAVVLPAPPAQAADQYFYDFFLSEDLSFIDSYFAGEKKDLSERYDTKDSEIICEKVKLENTNFIEDKDTVESTKRELGISHRQVNNCKFQGSYFFLDSSGKYDEKLLDKATANYGLKVTSNGELVMELQILELASNIRDIANEPDIGFARYVFPGKIKSVTPNIGKVSGNTFTLDEPLTGAERTKIEQSDDTITITAERHSSNLGLILGITIPAALIIVAVIVLLIVRSNRKKKQQPFPPYPAGSGTYPPPPCMPGNSPYPPQPQVPGYPAGPGAPGMPGAAPYPPNVPPPGQPGAVPYPPNVPPPAQPAAPTPGGYYPYPYPYPPANPQGSPAGHPMPPQSYGTPTSGFLPFSPPVQPAPAEGSEKSEPATESHSGKQVANSPQPGQSGKPAKSLASTQSEEEDGTGNPDGSNQASDSHQPKHAVEPAQADLTVLKTDPSEAITP